MKLREVSLEEILEAQSRQQAEKEEQDKLRTKIFKERGLAYTSENIMDDAYQNFVSFIMKYENTSDF